MLGHSASVTGIGSSVTSLDITGVTVSASDDLLLVGIGIYNTRSVTSVVWDPAGANEALVQHVTKDSSGYVQLDVWKLEAPTPGAGKTVRITFSAAAHVAVTVETYSSAAAPLGAAVTAVGGGSATSLTASSPTTGYDGLLNFVAIRRNATSSLAPGADETPRGITNETTYITVGAADELSGVSDPESGDWSWTTGAYSVMAVIPIKAAGGTTYTQSCAGAIASSGSVAKQDARAIAGAIASSGTAQLSTAKTTAGATPSSGVVARQTARGLAGVLTSAATLDVARVAVQFLSGAAASSGSLVRSTATAVSGAIASSGQATRSIARDLGGVVTSGGITTSVRTRLQSVGGVIASAGALARSTGKALAGTVTTEGAVTRRLARTLAGALVALGDVVAAVVGLFTRRPADPAFLAGSDDRHVILSGGNGVAVAMCGGDDRHVVLVGDRS